MKIVNNDGVVLLLVVYPGQLGCLSVTQLAIVNIGDVLSLLDSIQVFMQTIHQEGQEFLGVLLVIPSHLGHKAVNHTL